MDDLTPCQAEKHEELQVAAEAPLQPQMAAYPGMQAIPPVSVPEELPRKTKQVRGAICLAIMALCIALSFLFSRPETYISTNAVLDEQKSVTMGLVATTTSASIAISAIPGDVGSSISNQLADLSGKLAVILAIIYFEKFMMTTMGMVGMIVMAIGVGFISFRYLKRRDWQQRPGLMQFGIKIMVVGLCIATLVPVSTGISSMINNEYQVYQQAETTQQTGTDANEQAQAESSDQQQDESSDSSSDTQSSGNILDALGSVFSSGAEAVANGVSAVATGASDAINSIGNTLNSLIDTVAVMIVTSCLVPIVVLLFYFWIIKIVTGFDGSGYLKNAQRSVSAGIASNASLVHTKREKKQD